MLQFHWPIFAVGLVWRDLVCHVTVRSGRAIDCFFYRTYTIDCNKLQRLN
jgi:hypothetical protein